MKYTLAAGEEKTYPAQGRFLFIKAATGLLAVTVETADGRVSSYDLEKNDQVEFPARLAKVTVQDKSGAPNIIETVEGEGIFHPNQDGLEVVLTGSDVSLKVETEPGTPLEMESTDAKPVRVINKTGTELAVTGPVTDAQLRAVAVPVSGPVTDAELRAAAVATVLGAAVSGGADRFRLISAATTNASSVKAATGQVYALNGTNTSGATVYLKLYNLAAAPTVGTDTPAETYALPPGPFAFNFSAVGVEYAAGIALAITAAVADADATAIGAGDVVMQLHFA